MDKENKLGQEPVFPFFTWNIPGYGDTVTIQDKEGNMNHLAYTSGMSKRFYAACAAMQGILSNPNANPTHDEHFINIVEDAYKFADELLKQESNT